MNPAERESRRRTLASRLTGFSVDGVADPAHKLIDRCASILVKGDVKYIPWEKCAQRSQEIVDRPDVGALKLDAFGYLVNAPKEAEFGADVSTDLLLDQAWRRRALAADIAGLMAFESMNSWHEVLKAEYQRAPPPGYAKVSLGQLRAADEEVFRLVAAACREGCGKKAGKDRTSFEEAWLEATRDYGVRMRLQPLQGRGSSSSGGGAGSSGGGSGGGSETAKLNKQIADLKNQVSSLKRKSDNPKGNQKGSGKGDNNSKKKSRNANMPKELVGQLSRTESGEPICFAFNLNGCPDAPPGGRCSKGLHICAKPGCGKHHSFKGSH